MLLHELDRGSLVRTERIAVHPLFAGGGKLCLVLPCRGKERRTHFLTGRFVVDGELDDILLRDVR